jgi:hypothetical protein
MLAEITEKGLRGIGFTFLKNGGGDVFEFEVRSPCRFIVSVQNITQVRMVVPFIARTRRESLIEIRPLIGGERPGEVLSKAAESVVAALSTDIPSDKWKGVEELAS